MNRSRALGALLLAASVALLAACAPVARAAPRPPTDAQVRSILNDWIGQLSLTEADGRRIGFEGVQFRRFVSDSDWEVTMTRCVTSAGITGVVFRSNRVIDTVAVQAADSRAADYAIIRCELEYPDITLRSAVRTEQQLDYLWAYYAHSLIPCLRSDGIEIGKLPPEDEFRRASQRSLSIWNPYDAYHQRYDTSQTAVGLFHAQPHTDWLQKQCPPTPPGW